MRKTVNHSQIINGSPIPTFVIDRNHQVTHWNKACEALTGMSAEELIGTDFQWKPFYARQRSVMADLIIDKVDESAILGHYKGMSRKSPLVEGAYEAEGFYPILGKGGKWLLFTAAPIRNFLGRMVGAIETIQDITDNKIAEKKEHALNLKLSQSVTELQDSLELLRKTQHQLIQSEKMAALGGLVAGVAHEINTPVGISVTAASLLEEKTGELANLFSCESMKRSDLEAYVRLATESSRMILSNLVRAADLIQSFKQVAVDQSCEDAHGFNLKECLDNIVMTFLPKLRKGSHSVNVQCRDDLELHGYAGAIGQVISNLIMNSLIHGFEEMRNGAISIMAQEDAGQVEIRYSDNGKGISREYLERIFEPFFTTKRNKGGTGLGLHILYNLVTQTLGGRIECESTPGRGSTFLFRFPRVSPSGKGTIYSVQTTSPESVTPEWRIERNAGVNRRP
jgi:signal transduction histidine kinase